MNNKPNDSIASSDSRRDFIKKASTASAAAATVNLFKTPVYGQNQAPSVGAAGANNRIAVAHIGVGGQGMAHVRSMKANAADNNIVQVATCDVSKTRAAEARDWITSEDAKKPGRATKDVKTYEDHKKLLERKDIDAVVVGTVDHWHTACSVDAMNAGKHVYVEKPMTRYLGEAFEIYDTVKKTGKILQVGSQGCSDAKWHKAAELIKAGKIGQLVMLEGSYMRNSPKGEWNYAIKDFATETDIDWQRWLGPVRSKVSFSADHYFRWRKYYPYCAGLLGDLFPHRLHPYMLATGNPEFPKRVAAIGTKAIHTDRNTPGTPERDVAESVQMLAEFPSGLTAVIASATVSEFGLQEVIRGHKGRIEMGGSGRVEIKPERPYSEELDPQVFDNLKPVEALPPHEKNWFDCIRANKEPNAGINLAVRVQCVISLAEMSDRLQTVCLFDEKTRKITDGSGKELKPLTYGSLPKS
ncbi:MAG: Gfo/Idh/MocA family oxidoreductase [Verrucomicrobia bacterium]|nr:Gfo/Idh/MocA family oxidoreductase [Verrucomicrobiota bacterium]